ncbi:MAG: FeoB-associated Cys-rich membrane protein [Butyricicoccus sp.]|nr:FeoB-associated Cys-rich membrane protein [Butyricicoccus sp.]
MADLMIVAVVAVIIGLVSRYIYKEKKSGAVCIGCPSGGCNGCCSGCSGCGDQH